MAGSRVRIETCDGVGGSPPMTARFEPPRLYLPAPLHSVAFLFSATFITLSTTLLSGALPLTHSKLLTLLQSPLFWDGFGSKGKIDPCFLVAV